MQGDFSRLTFDPVKQYSRIWMQQGRVQLDADWNELVEMLNHRLETECRDLLGTFAVPKDNPGFGIRFRKGLKFDGKDDCVWVGKIKALSFPGFHPFTIEAWVNPDATGSGGTIVSKFHSSEPTPEGEYCLSVQSDRTLLFQRVELQTERRLVEQVTVIPSETPSREKEFILITELLEKGCKRVLRPVTTKRSIPDGQFSHVAVVCDRREIKLYINGRLAAYSPSQYPGNHSHHPFLIGSVSHSGTPSHSFKGVIDAVQVWHTARTQTQLQDDLHQMLMEPKSELVANWQFDEGEGNEIADLSSNSHTGYRGDDRDGAREACKPEWVPADVWIRPGRGYVEGILCDNEAEILLTKQPYRVDRLCNLMDLPTGSYLVYLDVWQRFVSAIEDPTIREVALGGIDTTARSQIIWQVHYLHLPQKYSINREHAQFLLEERQPSPDQRGKLKVRQISAESLPDNRLYRVEIHSGGGAYGDRAPHRWQSAYDVSVVTPRQIIVNKDWTIAQDWAIGQCVELKADADDIALGILAQIVDSDPDTHCLTLDALLPDWVVGTSTKLRVIAAFKWSRDNGALVFAIDRLKQNSVTLQDVRQNSSILKADNWVEILDDDTVLGGLVSSLYQIDAVELGNNPIVHLKQPPTTSVGRNPAKHPLLRCWDQTQLVKMGVIPVRLQPTDATDGVSTDDAIELENGIQIEFEGSYFQQGDFWWLPTRMPIEGGTAQGIVWRYDANGQPLARSPHSMTHHYAPLATLDVNDSTTQLHDLRQFFVLQSEAPVGSVQILGVRIQEEKIQEEPHSEASKRNIWVIDNQPKHEKLNEVESKSVELTELLKRLDSELVKLALFGKASVGKTAIANSLIGEDFVKLEVQHDLTVRLKPYIKQPWSILDVRGSLGIKINEELGSADVKEAHVHLFVINGEPSDQELELFKLVHKTSRNIPKIVFVNKWDLMKYTPEEEVDIRRDRITNTMGQFVGSSQDDIVYGNALLEEGNKKVRQELLSLIRRMSKVLGG